MSSISFEPEAICLVGNWSYKTETDTCSLCREHLTIPPTGTNSLNIVEGRCGHVFHEYCINKWKSNGVVNTTNTTCPSDNTEFIICKTYRQDMDWMMKIPKVPESK